MVSKRTLEVGSNKSDTRSYTRELKRLKLGTKYRRHRGDFPAQS
jgi:hypothetical protein